MAGSHFFLMRDFRFWQNVASSVSSRLPACRRTKCGTPASGAEGRKPRLPPIREPAARSVEALDGAAVGHETPELPESPVQRARLAPQPHAGGEPAAEHLHVERPGA